MLLCRTRPGAKGVKRRSRPKLLRAYHCDTCNGWHLTKSPNRNEW